MNYQIRDERLRNLLKNLKATKLFDDRTIDGKFYSKMVYGKEVTGHVWDDIKTIESSVRETYSEVLPRLNVDRYSDKIGVKP